MISFTKQDSTIKISFNKPELDISDAKELETILSSVSAEKYDRLIFNFDGVKFMSATAMRRVAKLIQDAKNKNASVSSIGKIDHFLHQLFSISGLEGYIGDPEITS